LTGLARSRKAAKRNAAETLLRLIKQDHLEFGAENISSLRQGDVGVSLGNGLAAVTKSEDNTSEDIGYPAGAVSIVRIPV